MWKCKKRLVQKHSQDRSGISKVQKAQKCGHLVVLIPVQRGGQPHVRVLIEPGVCIRLLKSLRVWAGCGKQNVEILRPWPRPLILLNREGFPLGALRPWFFTSYTLVSVHIIFSKQRGLSIGHLWAVHRPPVGFPLATHSVNPPPPLGFTRRVNM
jgi:hypothetical protein